MTSAHEKDLLRKELPNNVKVANKIGVYQGSNPSQQVGSDCGIIYFPQRPYLLCAMVSTGSQDSAASHISTLSKITYDFISTNTK